MANFLTTNTITWTFDKELTLTGAADTYQYGQYCNDDYWVVGPATVINISPDRGSELNVIATSWDQGLTGGARNINGTIPRTFQPSSSILTAAGSGNCSGVYLSDRMNITYAAVLTIVTTPPPNLSFRPGYGGLTKTVMGAEADIRYDRLARVTPSSGMPSLSYYTGLFDQVRPSHLSQQATVNIRPCGQGAVGYGSNNGGQLSEAVLAANCDFTAQQKRDLVISLIQQGIDHYSVVSNKAPGAAIWVPNGGHGHNFKLAIIFAGIVLDNAELMAVGEKSGAYLPDNPGNAPADYMYFATDSSVYYVTQFNVDLGIGYVSGDIGLPEWQIRYATQPSRIEDDNEMPPDWGASYRVHTASGWGAGILALHMMSDVGINAKAIYNHDALFDYLDRYIGIELGGTWDFNRHPNSSWVRSMWINYRNAYPPVWPNTTAGDTTPPLAPTNLVSPQQTDTTISLSWTAAGAASDGDFPVGYRIYRDAVLQISITGTSYTDTGLTANTAYDYDIYSYDDAGNNSAAALSNTFSTEVAPPAITTVYINGSGDSANGGTSWADALDTLPAVLTRGATYYIGAGNFGAYTFDDAQDTNTITIQKATLTDHGSDTGWDQAYAGLAQWGNLRFLSTSYIDFLGASVGQTLIRHNGPSPQISTIEIDLSTNIRVEYSDIDGMNGGVGNVDCSNLRYDDSSYIYIEHCTVHEAGDDNISVLRCDHVYWRWNRIYSNYGLVCLASNGHSDVFEFTAVDDAELIGNFVYGGTSTSLFFTSNTAGTCNRLYLANNIFYNNEGVWYTMYFGNTTYVSMYNNIVWGERNGEVTGIAIEYDNTNMDFQNNIFGGITTRNGGYWDVATNTGDNNIIYNSPVGYNIGSNDLIGVDPKFTGISLGSVIANPSIADFAPLDETAPSIDAGTAIAEVSFDIQHNSRPQGVGTDIGAFEYAGSVVTVGACCNPATGECSITTDAQCTFNWLGAGSTCAACATPVPTTGLVVSYPCDDLTGLIAADASGNSTDGTLIGDAAFTATGEVLQTHGQNGVQFNLTNAECCRGTIAAAIYPNVVTGIDLVYYVYGHTVGAWSNRIQIYIADGYLHIGMGDNHFNAVDVMPIAIDDWYHIIFTWLDNGITISNGDAIGTATGNGTWILYIDGIALTNGTYSGLDTLNTTADFGNTGLLGVGFDDEGFDGYMDNLKLYDIPLTASDAADLAFIDGREVAPPPPSTIDPPVVINTAASLILPNSATMGGEITDTGGEIPSVILYYGDDDAGEVAANWDYSINLGDNLSTFAVSIGSLTHNTTYFFRCYAFNSGGSDWADSSATFDTLEITAPTLTQNAATNVGITTVTLSGDITDQGNETPVVTVYYGDNDGVTTPGNWDEAVVLSLASDDSFSTNITGLAANTPHFFRFLAENATGGQTWGSATLTFTTDPTGAPTIINVAATEIDGYNARIAGEVTDVGSENPTVTVYWGTSDGGVIPANWENTASFGVQTGAFNVLLTSLTLATIYYYRAYATNSFGNDWANSTQSFSTLAVQPISPDPNDKVDGFLWGTYNNAYEIVTPYDNESIFDVHKVSRGDVTFMAHSLYHPRKLTRYGDRNWTMEEIDFVGGPFLDTNIDTDKTIQYINGTGGTTGNYYNVGNTGRIDAGGHAPFLEEMVGSLWSVTHTRQDNVRNSSYNNNHAQPPNSHAGIRIKGDWQFDVSNMSGGTPNYTAKIWRKALPGDWQEIRHYSGATLASGDEDEEDVFYTWTASNSAVEGALSAIGARNIGIVKITSFTSTNQVSVMVVKAVYQESGESAAVTDWAEGAWNGYRGYPSSVTFYGDRLWWSGTTNNPQGLWGSKVGYYEDHTSGVSDSDAISRVISDNDISSIEWLTASQALMIGSAKKEYVASAADRRDPITPKDLEVRPHSTNGSMPIQPVEIDGGMMYAQRLGYKMLILHYEYLSDSYESVDANRLSPHMFKYPATSISKQGTPETVVWVTRADGTLCDFRYDKNEEIAAWSRIVTGEVKDSPTHAFISTAVVAGDTEDRVWCVVQRLVDGQTHYYVERFANRNYIALSDSLYLDCATTVTSDSLGTLSRLYYLEGHTVTLMLDTEKVGSYTISAGQITGLTPDTEYVIGLPYLCRMKTMMFAVPGVVTEGTIKRFLNVLVRTVRTRGGQIGVETHGQANMVDLDIEYSLLATDVEKFGEGGFDRESRIILEFNDPYPATVLALVFEVDIE